VGIFMNFPLDRPGLNRMNMSDLGCALARILYLQVGELVSCKVSPENCISLSYMFNIHP
jgi:hypothetical protein